eukprot:SRR837773.3777.p3 GENE.SRR837773.3777~~SRR837773.3777.p3  ORF type:complete len:200 (+),score=114.05 SRR837773.3777:65-601(+)
MMGKKSDVYVEVSIEGKPKSKVTTAVVTGKAAPRLGAEPGEKDSVEVELNFVGELPDFAEGDKILFVVKDKDLMTSDLLGKATVSDAAFGGRLELEGAGDGYKAFLMVQLGDGSAMADAVAGLKAAAEKAKAALASAITETVGAENAKKLQDAADQLKDKAQDAIEEIQVKSGMWCGC